MRTATDPLDALALFLSELFGREVSLTLVLDVFAGITAIGIGIFFIFNIRNISKKRGSDE